MNEDTIRVLAVRQPWASLIVEGLKTIEVRSRNTNIRERVAIYASSHRPTKNELSSISYLANELEEAGFLSLHDLNEINVIMAKSRMPEYYNMINRVLGTVEIVKSSAPCSNIVTENREPQHLIPNHLINNYASNSKICFWHLKNPVKFPEPIPLVKWPSGGPWAKVPKSMLPGESA